MLSLIRRSAGESVNIVISMHGRAAKDQVPIYPHNKVEAAGRRIIVEGNLRCATVVACDGNSYLLIRIV
jgi:uncharacterized Zn finger protein